MKIRIELSSLASRHQSGVAMYTKLLTESLSKRKDISLFGHYFNFADRQPRPGLASSHIQYEENRFIPLRVYAKLQSHDIALPFDITLPKVDATIFPNFATWPTIHSGICITVVHDLTYLYYPDAVEEKNLQHLKRVIPRSLRDADIVVTVSEAVKSELVKEFSLTPSKCIVTPIPPDASFSVKQTKKILAKVHKKYAIPTTKYLYFIGNLEPRKNIIDLIDAYLLLPDAVREEYSLIIAGGGGWKAEDARSAISDAVKKGENIRHIGFIDQADSPALYQGASLFVMPSLYEGFGIPVLEAMASGCSVVATDIPALREAGGKAAMYVPPNNPKALSKAIIKQLHQKPDVDKMQKNLQRFSWDKNVSVLINAIESSQKNKVS